VILDPQTFALGVLTGVAGAGIFIGFAAALVTFAGADSDKRGLSGRHRPGALAVGELPVTHIATLPVVAPPKKPKPRNEAPIGIRSKT
jgi:hypothetical protein